MQQVCRKSAWDDAELFYQRHRYTISATRTLDLLYGTSAVSLSFMQTACSITCFLDMHPSCSLRRCDLWYLVIVRLPCYRNCFADPRRRHAEHRSN
jgi:hypothetical protein